MESCVSAGGAFTDDLPAGPGAAFAGPPGETGVDRVGRPAQAPVRLVLESVRGSPATAEERRPSSGGGLEAVDPGARRSVPGDGYLWLKYGEKRLARTGLLRSYWKCADHASTGCKAKKMADWECPLGVPLHGAVLLGISYQHEHNHPQPRSLLPRGESLHPGRLLVANSVTQSHPFRLEGAGPPISECFNNGVAPDGLAGLEPAAPSFVEPFLDEASPELSVDDYLTSPLPSMPELLNLGHCIEDAASADLRSHQEADDSSPPARKKARCLSPAHSGPLPLTFLTPSTPSNSQSMPLASMLSADTPGSAGTPVSTGTPVWTGTPVSTGSPVWTATPVSTGTPASPGSTRSMEPSTRQVSGLSVQSSAAAEERGEGGCGSDAIAFPKFLRRNDCCSSSNGTKDTCCGQNHSISCLVRRNFQNSYRLLVLLEQLQKMEAAIR